MRLLLASIRASQQHIVLVRRRTLFPAHVTAVPGLLSTGVMPAGFLFLAVPMFKLGVFPVPFGCPSS